MPRLVGVSVVCGNPAHADLTFIRRLPYTASMIKLSLCWRTGLPAVMLLCMTVRGQDVSMPAFQDRRPLLEEPHEPLVERNYSLDINFRDEGEPASAAASERFVMKFLTDNGIPWPRGSSVRLDAVLNQLTVVHTAAEQMRIGNLLLAQGYLSVLVEIDVQFVAFPTGMVARLGPEGINLAALTTMWTNGHGRSVASPRVVTRVGQEAVVKAVKEYIYPTEFVGL